MPRWPPQAASPTPTRRWPFGGAGVRSSTSDADALETVAGDIEMLRLRQIASWGMPSRNAREGDSDPRRQGGKVVGPPFYTLSNSANWVLVGRQRKCHRRGGGL